MKASVRLTSLPRSRSVLQPCIHHRSTISISALPLQLSTCRPIPPHSHLFIPQTRTLFDFFRRKKLEDSQGVPKSITELLQNKPPEEQLPTAQPKIKRGELAPSSIFDKEESTKAAPDGPAEVSSILKRATSRISILKEGGIYPNEDSFMRKYRIRMIKRRGRLNRTEQIQRSEKEHLCKSHNFKTSLKKLGPLARQIAGKPLEHAMAQMRFSPKKASKEIYKHLEQAKNEAILTKNFDPAQTYIAQAWVGRGTPDYEVMKRARSRIDRLTKPYTSISIVLKENKTLERIAREKEEKIKKRKVWVPMPNRPIYGQHQYYTW